MEKSTLKEDLLIAGTGLALLAVCLWKGIGITFDSHLYLLGSSYLTEHGFKDVFTVPAFRTKPPVLSVLYALLQQNISLIKVSNLVFLLGTLLVNFRLVTILISDTFFRRFTKVLLATATPFLLVHSFLWSEPFFVFILSLYFLLGYKALLQTRQTVWLYLLPVLGLLLIGLRHIGIVFALIYSLYLLLHWKRFSTLQHIPLLLNLLLPPLALLFWHTNVLAYGGNAGEYNLIRELDLLRNFLVYAEVLKVWLVPPVLPFPEFASVVAFGIYVVAAILAVKQSYTSETRHLVVLFVVSTAGYAGLMLLKGDLLADDNERYLSVLYAPLTILLFYVISNWVAQATINRKLIWLFFILWFSYPLIRTLHNVNRWSQTGINSYDPGSAPKEILEGYQNPEPL